MTLLFAINAILRANSEQTYALILRHHEVLFAQIEKLLTLTPLNIDI